MVMLYIILNNFTKCYKSNFLIDRLNMAVKYHSDLVCQIDMLDQS